METKTKKTKKILLTVVGVVAAVAVGLGAYMLTGGGLFKGMIGHPTEWNNQFEETPAAAGLAGPNGDEIIIGNTPLSATVTYQKAVWLEPSAANIGIITFTGDMAEPAVKATNFEAGQKVLLTSLNPGSLQHFVFTPSATLTGGSLKIVYGLDYNSSAKDTFQIVHPTVSLSLVSPADGKLYENLASGSQTATIRATITPAINTNVTVPLLFAGTASKGPDYSFANSISIPANTTSVNFPFATALNDSLVETDETIIVDMQPALVPPSVIPDPASQPITFTIVSDDVADVHVNLTSAPSPATIYEPLDESDNPSAFTVTATLPAGILAPTDGVNIPVTYDTASTATIGSDYNLKSNNGTAITTLIPATPLVILPNTNSGTLTVTALTDTTQMESAETVKFSFGTPTSGYVIGIGGSPVTVTITDTTQTDVEDLFAIGSTHDLNADGKMTVGEVFQFTVDSPLNMPASNHLYVFAKDGSGTLTVGTKTPIATSVGTTLSHYIELAAGDVVQFTPSAAGQYILAVAYGSDLTGAKQKVVAEVTSDVPEAVLYDAVAEDSVIVSLLASSLSISESQSSTVTASLSTADCLAATFTTQVFTLTFSGTAVLGTDYTKSTANNTITITRTGVPATCTGTITITGVPDAVSPENSKTLTIGFATPMPAGYTAGSATTITLTDAASGEPTPVSTVPTANATSVSSAAGTASVTFAETGLTTNPNADITLRKSGSIYNPNLVTRLLFTGSTKTLSIVYSALEANTLYTVTVPAGSILNGTVGNDAIVWSFTTASTGTPTVVSHVPATNATDVSVSAGYATVTFLEANLVFDDTKNITVNKTGGLDLSVAVPTYSQTYKTLSIPYGALEANTTYTVYVPAGTLSLGTVPCAAITWSFSTAANVGAPVISNLNVDPDSFDPSDNENTEITFRTDKTASITVVIADEDDEVVRTFSDYTNDSYSLGTHSITWNGEDDDEDVVDDGDYEVQVLAENSVGSDFDSDAIEVGTGGNGDCDADYDDADEMDDTELCDAVKWVTDEDIFTGYPNGTFRPNKKINRVELVKVLMEGFDVDEESADLNFTDIDYNAWYEPYLETAYANGIIRGDAGKHTFRPDDPVNRVETLKMVFQTLRVTDKFEIDSCDSSPYDDTDEDQWYIDYVCLSDEYKLFDVDDDEFEPASDVTRGEVALVLYRLHDQDVF